MTNRAERRQAVLAPRGHALLARFEGRSGEFTADYRHLKPFAVLSKA